MYTWGKVHREGVRYLRARREGQGGGREARRRGGRRGRGRRGRRRKRGEKFGGRRGGLWRGCRTVGR